MGNDTMSAVLHLATDDYHRIWQHLFDDGSCTEASGFLFVRHQPQAGQHIFVYLEWYPVPPDGYAVRNEFHFELTDEVRAQVIKRAHDLDASIVEVHSHGGSWPAAFSPSDQWGFREFVPHVWWRLKGRPYLAVVWFAPKSSNAPTTWTRLSLRFTLMAVHGQLLFHPVINGDFESSYRTCGGA